ncbi:MAG TPA: DNA mismatch repair protein MutL, partial [Hanamia sp.]
EDEKLIYAFVQSAVKHALAQYSVTPTLDFDLDASIQQTDAVSKPFTSEKQFSATGTSLYNTFTQKNQAHFIESKSNIGNWDDPIFKQNKPDPVFENILENKKNEEFVSSPFKNPENTIPDKKPNSGQYIQLHKTFIVAQNENGFIVIHQQNAHERVLYERFTEALKGKPIAIQRSLFPAAIQLAPADALLLSELIGDLNILGYQVEPFGNNSFVIQGSPADVPDGNEKDSLEKILEQYKHFNMDMSFSKREKLLRSMAWQQSIRPGAFLSQKEMEVLVEDLFSCNINNTTPNGKPVFLEFKKDELVKMFGR